MGADVFTTVNNKEVCCSIVIDNEAMVVHMMDNDYDDTYSLTNAMSDEFLKDSVIGMYRRTLPLNKYPIHEYDEYRYLLYGTDGMVCEWIDGDFKNISDDIKPLQSFMGEMTKRRIGIARKGLY